MAEIAPLSNERCVHRGVSTMRLALGYETGLPEDWWFKPEGGLDSPNGFADEIRQIKQAFPNHDAVIFCNPTYTNLWQPHGLRHDEYTNLYSLPAMCPTGDEALFAFSYIHHGNRAHFVVGNPVDLDRTLYVIAVFGAT